MTSSILFQIRDAKIVRPNGESIFEDLSWTIREGEAWAIVGGVGSGKSSLTDVLLGRLRVLAGEADWPLVDRLRAEGRTINWPSEIVGRVAFKEESRLFSYSKHYYQQRFNFIEPDDDLTLEQFLRTGTNSTNDEFVRITTRLGVADLLPLSFIKLSNGQTRRSRIAKALLTRPEILVLDEPFVGLDVAGREELRTILQQLVDSGSRLVTIVSANAIPEFVTHVLELTNRCVTYSGQREGYVAKSAGTSNNSRDQVVDSKVSVPETMIELKNVTVRYAGQAILNDVSWTVRAGERWAILGPNGSGKTTLLSVICGDHPQAYSNFVRFFGRQRGDGDSMWEIKKRIGFFSPELHLYFTEPLTADRAAATGFFDVLVPRPTTPQQDAAVRDFFDYFEAGDLRDRYFARLSTGQQRIVLFIRALVKNPPLLVLDEPFQVLDSRTKELARQWIDKRAPADQAVLFVTHDEGELPRTVTRRLNLERGAVAS